MDKSIVLFENKKDCSACGACMNVCPKGAISMVVDEYGFPYPQIDNEKCIKCGACKRVCGFQDAPEYRSPEKVYAACTKDINLVKKSASGGVFATMARKVLLDGGYVYGVSNDNDGTVKPKHVCISSVEELTKLQGSKYVQSDTNWIYKDVKEKAIKGEKVLFSGTPCQVASLRKFLGKDYENVILLEIICHGVPSSQLFTDFISYKEKKLAGKIKEFYFRDKTRGQGYTTKTVYDTNGSTKEKIAKGELTAYVRFFSKSLSLRENCYYCPFAKKERVADITIGDYWGFHKEHPEVSADMLGDRLGVSCVLCNTEKGISFMQDCSDDFVLLESEYSKVAKHNKQLNGPSGVPADRTIVLETYKNGGYAALEKLYWRKYPKDKLKYAISVLMPKGAKAKIKNILGK